MRPGDIYSILDEPESFRNNPCQVKSFKQKEGKRQL